MTLHSFQSGLRPAAAACHVLTPSGFKAVLIPVGGFFSDTGGNWVYVLDKSGKKAQKRKITLGRKNPEYFEVLEGLQVGDQIVKQGILKVNPGGKVQPQDEAWRGDAK